VTENEGIPTTPPNTATPTGPWLNVEGAARRALCGSKLIYREVAAKRLRAARVGGRRELRFRPEWIDQWLDQSTTF
jgi:excisionase family DNA binding protein